METKLYTCGYCFEEFKPRRRYVQKYCSNSCRSKAHHIRNKNLGVKPVTETSMTVNKIDRMSVAGIGNATAGTVAANVITKALTSYNNKPATKGDIIALSQKIERYQRVMNLALGINGELPYFDMVTKQIVYFKNLGTTT